MLHGCHSCIHLVAGAAVLVLVLGRSAFAQPAVSVTNIGANADGNLQWRVDVEPDASLFTRGQGSLAAEIGFELNGAVFLDAAVNESVWAFANPGFNPFTDTITNGLSLAEAATFASFGSEPVDGLVELLTGSLHKERLRLH